VAQDSSKIVIMGKSRTHAPQEMLDLLSTIEPAQVPHTVLDQVFVTLQDASKYQIDKQHLKNGIDYDQIVNHIKAAGAKSPIDVVEVIIDIDYVSRLLDKEMHNILDPVFG